MTTPTPETSPQADVTLRTARQLRETDGPQAALDCLRQLSQIEAQNAEVQHLIGLIHLHDRKDPEDALSALEQAVSSESDSVFYRTTLADCLCQLDRPRQALDILQRVSAADRDSVDVLDLIARSCLQAGLIDDGLLALRRIVDLQPNCADRAHKLAESLADNNRSKEAHTAWQQARRQHPQDAAIAVSFGLFLIRQGQTAAAIEVLNEALPLDSLPAEVPSLLLLYLMVASETTQDDLVRAGQYWSTLHQPQIRHRNYPNTPDPERPLRIGYVSGDLVWHSITYFFSPLLAHRDRSQFQVFCYSNTPKSDSGTTMLRSQTDHWRDITGMDDHSAAEQIRSDGIDILLDMSGHMRQNRLPLFGLRPAPVQVGWQGYVGSRYVDVLDYWITDEVTDPDDADIPDNCGQPLRIPGGYHVYSADPEAQFPVAPLPSERTGCITFGSFNQQGKIQPETVQLWSQVLQAVPGSRMLLKATGFSDPYTVDHFRNLFTDHGITHDRLLFVGPKVVRRHHFELYGQVDMALDTFPHHGITTTCEALWMGVPVVVLKGRRTESRVGAGLMKQMGLDDWVAQTSDDYVRIAVDAAQKPAALSNLRRTMRERMASSQLGNPAAAVPRYEAALRSVWRTWCERSES